jgi:hypothetical protein
LRTSASITSPHSEGRPLMTAMFWIACIVFRPSSAPHWIAIRQFAGFSLKSLGTMSLSARYSAMRHASSKLRGLRSYAPGITASAVCSEGLVAVMVSRWLEIKRG